MKQLKHLVWQLLVAATLVVGIGLAAPVAAAPSSVFNTDVCKSDPNNTICPKDNNSGVFSLAKNVINTLLVIAGIVAVIVIIVGGISYTVSSGDQAKVKKAKDTVLYAVIGLVVSILSFAIVNFVLSRL